MHVESRNTNHEYRITNHDNELKYYIISGEASGDLHASNLLKAIRAHDPDARVRAWGGELLEAQGAELVRHYRDLSFMGFKEVIMNIRTILRHIQQCKDDIAAWKPDVIIFVDYPGFNIRVAEWARKAGFKTVYYISPQVWAWKAKRALKLKRDVDRMIVILPFEEEFYSRYSFKVKYVGHPLLDVIPAFQPSLDFHARHGLASDKPIIALLPGSRRQEIMKNLPVMLSMIPKFPHYQFVVAGAPAQEESLYRSIEGAEHISIVFGQTYDLLAHAYAALVASGTATLEVALFGVPEVVCYRGSKLSYQIAKRLVNIKYISLVNLIMNRLVVTELIQHDLTSGNMEHELRRITEDPEVRSRMLADYAELRERLGGSGASERAAKIILDFLQPNLG